MTRETLAAVDVVMVWAALAMIVGLVGLKVREGRARRKATERAKASGVV